MRRLEAHPCQKTQVHEEAYQVGMSLRPHSIAPLELTQNHIHGLRPEAHPVRDFLPGESLETEREDLAHSWRGMFCDVAVEVMILESWAHIPPGPANCTLHSPSIESPGGISHRALNENGDWWLLTLAGLRIDPPYAKSGILDEILDLVRSDLPLSTYAHGGSRCNPQHLLDSRFCSTGIHLGRNYGTTKCTCQGRNRQILGA